MQSVYGLNRLRIVAIWAAVAVVFIVPIIAAGMSPLLAWRNPVYIVAGFSGVFALCLMLLQPMLAGGMLPGMSPPRRRRIHRWVGGVLVVSLLIHLVGLWVTSPPDVVDALLFVSATPFSNWGVIAMWSVLITACLVVFRRNLGLSVRTWRLSHRSLATVTVIGSVVHALMIEGSMETLSKAVLCACIVIASALTLLKSANQ